MNTSISSEIVSFLEKKGKTSKPWRFGGQIEDWIRMDFGNKASCVSRRLRELSTTKGLKKEEKPRLAKDYELVNGRMVVKYKIYK